MIAANKKSKSRTVSEPDYSCQTAIALIGNYLAGSITLHAREDFEHHFGLCPDCAAFLKTYKKTIEVTRAFLRSQTPSPALVECNFIHGTGVLSLHSLSGCIFSF